MARYPLNLFAAYLAAMLCNFLLTMGPGLIKVFISEATRGVERHHLLVIACLLIGSLILSYFFDVIQGHISAHFKMQIEADLRTIYQRYCQHHRSGQREMAHGRGIYALTEFCHHLVLDIPIGISTIVLISSFMMLENTYVGLGVLCLSFIFLAVIIKSISFLGRLSRFKEVLKQDYLRKSEKNATRLETVLEYFIDRITWAENKRLFWDNLILFCSFTLFRIIPALLLFYFAAQNSMDFGKATALLLSFNLLHRPFTQLVMLYKQAIMFYAQSSLIRPDLEAGLLADELTTKTPRGLILVENDAEVGKILTQDTSANLEHHHLFRLEHTPEAMAHWPAQLKRLAHERQTPIFVFERTGERCHELWRQAHFYKPETGALRVALEKHHEKTS